MVCIIYLQNPSVNYVFTFFYIFYYTISIGDVNDPAVFSLSADQAI